MRILEDVLLVVAFVRFVRDDRNTFGHVCANATGMIRVVVCIDEVFDRLVGEHPLYFADRCQGLVVTPRSFDNDEVIFELDCDTPLRAIIQNPGTAADFLRLDADSRGRLRAASSGATAALGVAAEFQCGGTVRLHAVNCDIEDWIAALTLHDVHGKFHATKVFVAGINAFNQRISRKTAVDSRLDCLDETLFVDRSRYSVLPKCRERYKLVLSAHARYLRPAIRRCAVQEAMRCQPNVESSI